VWCSFAGIILSVFRTQFPGFLYVDDFFGAAPLKLRVPRPFATAQWELLRTFEHLGIPFDLAKAPAGRRIEIIGLFVDLNILSISLSPERRAHLVDELAALSQQSVATVGRLRQLAGWITWASQAMPQTRPFTFSLYRAVGTLTNPDTLVPFSHSLRRDLRTLAFIITGHAGKHFLSATLWPLEAADAVFFVDACTSYDGIGVYYPARALGLWCTFPIRGVHINTLEGCAVWLAWSYAIEFLGSANRRVVIYCDNMAAVGAFNKLYSRSPAICSLVRSLAWHTLDFDCTLRVIHTPGVKNVMADALSRQQFALARRLVPALDIQTADSTRLQPFATAWQQRIAWSPLAS
jgi:hypothetical protein